MFVFDIVDSKRMSKEERVIAQNKMIKLNDKEFLGGNCIFVTHC